MGGCAGTITADATQPTIPTTPTELVEYTQPSTDATPGTSAAAIVTATVAVAVAVFVLGLLGIVFLCQRSPPRVVLGGVEQEFNLGDVALSAETGDHPEFADPTVDEQPTWYAAFALRPGVSPFEPTHPNLWGSFSA